MKRMFIALLFTIASLFADGFDVQPPRPHPPQVFVEARQVQADAVPLPFKLPPVPAVWVNLGTDSADVNRYTVTLHLTSGADVIRQVWRTKAATFNPANHQEQFDTITLISLPAGAEPVSIEASAEVVVSDTKCFCFGRQ